MMLIHLQVHSGKAYTERCIRNFTRYETIPSPRGRIVDCNGRAIATNRPIINVYWHGTEHTHWQPHQQYMLQRLEHLFSRRLHDDPHLLACERLGRDYPIAHDISLETLSAITEQCFHMANIRIETQFQRYYPFATHAAHLIGHIDRSEHGQMGIERLCDTSLTGQPGYAQKQISATGKIVDYTHVTPAHSGKTITTTLDMDLQQCAEDAFLPEEYNGTILCIDGTDGSIKALASRPTFDPNAFTTGVDPVTWHTWQHTCALLNRASHALYPPASIFKLITTATALEEGLITPSSTWYCSGYTRYGKRMYACNKQSGHGGITIVDAIAHSCNIPFYEIGKELSIDTIAEYAHAFGLNAPTGIILSEQSGLVPTHAWKSFTLGERWWQGETLAATIGQSYLLVTPLQVACMANAICQGYLVRPRILHNEPVHIQHLDISDHTRTILQDAVRTVVTEGRAHEMRELEQTIDRLTLYAKTGTAQTSHKFRRSHGTQFREHGWFFVHARYKDNRPITLVVLLEHIGSSRIAGQAARRFIESYCNLCDTRNILQ